MKFKTIVIILLVLALAIPSVSSARERIHKHEGELTIWQNELTGSLNLGNAGYNLRTNFKGDGDFGKKTTPGFGWMYNIGKLSDVYIHYNKVENSGRLRAIGTGAVSFNGTNYTVVGGVATIDLNLKMDIFDILGAREITKGENGYLDFVYGFKIMKCSFDAVDAANVNNRASYNVTLPLPNFGVRGVYFINKDWNAYGQFSGFSLNRSGKGGTLKYIDFGVEYKIKKQTSKNVDWSVMLGYKDEYIKGNDDNNNIVIEHKGPQFKVVGRF